MAETYEKIATNTLSSNTASVTFTSISAAYTDLVLVMSGKAVSGEGAFIIKVGDGSIDSGSNYSFTYLYGNGSSGASARSSNSTSANGSRYDTTAGIGIIQFMNYANTSVYKTFLNRGSSGAMVQATVNLWRSTSAINQIFVQPESLSNMVAGYTLTIYGIKAA